MQIILAVIILCLFGCSIQPEYTPAAALDSAKTIKLSVTKHNSVIGTKSSTNWWAVLDDPAINELITAAFASNPSLEEAMARVEEAQAQLIINRSSYFPHINGDANINQSYLKIAGSPTIESRTTSIGPSLSWEIDLFGRIRSSVALAKSRIDARSYDADKAVLLLASDVANNVLDLRACRYAGLLLTEQVKSWQKTFDLVSKKVTAGMSAPVDAISITRDLANAQINLATKNEECDKIVNALVALTGMDQSKVYKSINIRNITFIPRPPQAVPELPATILLSHPNIQASDRDAEAAWFDIAVARANRWPKINLTALLTGTWLRETGKATVESASWAIAPKIAAVLFDGGNLAASVDSAAAEYRAAVARLRNTLLTTIKEIENALTEQKYVSQRYFAATKSFKAAKAAYNAKQQQWRTGAISLLELEDSHRQLAIAQDNLVIATRDRAKAWVHLVSATGNSLTNINEKIKIANNNYN